MSLNYDKTVNNIHIENSYRREILFRGKSIDGNWYYGVPLVFTEDYVCITAPYNHNKSVIPETVGQYTGLTDKNGKKIFEGDVVKLYLIDGEEIGVIKYNDKMCRFMFFTKDGSYSFDDTDDFEVIGNIHDNPELLKGGVE